MRVILASFITLLSTTLGAYQYSDSKVGFQVDFPDWPESGAVQVEHYEAESVYQWKASPNITHMYCGVEGEYYPTYKVAVHPLSSSEKLSGDYDALQAFSYQVYEKHGSRLIESSWQHTQKYGYIYNYSYKLDQKTYHHTALVVKGKRYIVTSIRIGENRQVGCGTLHFAYPDHTRFFSSFSLKKHR